MRPLVRISRDCPGRFGFGAGHAFIVVGILVILIATIRFVRTGRLLDDQAIHTPGILPDLAFGVILALLLIVLSFYLIA
jgi:putative membrane protein